MNLEDRRGSRSQSQTGTATFQIRFIRPTSVELCKWMSFALYARAARIPDYIIIMLPVALKRDPWFLDVHFVLCTS